MPCAYNEIHEKRGLLLSPLFQDDAKINKIFDK